VGRRVAVAPRWVSLTVVARIASCALVVAVLFVCAGALGLGLYGYAHTGRIYEGVTAGGVPIGGLTRTEAQARLEARFDAFLDQPLILVAGDRHFTVDGRAVGASLDAETTLRSAFAVGRDGSWWERTRAWARAGLHGRDVPLTATVDQDRLDAWLLRIVPEVTRPASDASVTMTGPSGPTIVPESPGIALDLTSTRSVIVERLGALSHEPVVLVTPAVDVEVTAAEMQPGLERAQAVVARSLVVNALDTSWAVASEDLARIVAVRSGGEIDVDREAVKSLVGNIAAEIERPSRDAAIDVGDDGAVAVVPGTASIDVAAKPSVDAVIAALQAGRHKVALVVEQTAPAIGEEQATVAAARVDALLGNGIHLRWDGGNADLGRGELASALTIDVDPGAIEPFRIGFDHERLGSILAPLADQIDVPAQDVVLRLVGSKVTVVEKETVGRRLNVERTIEAIESAMVNGGSRDLELIVDVVKPAYTAADAKKIKLSDVLAASSTSYADSSDARRHNVEQAAKLETGWLVPPGGQFSYDRYVGKVTKKEGFVTGFGIVASPEGDGTVTTAPVVGGGICQVSTTVFQAAFWAGLQIDERHEHPYWLATYGEPPRGMKGLDAMVNIEEDWSLDLRFTNTTGNWIAVVVVADGQDVTAEIRGVDPGWSVAVDQPVITDVVPADDNIYYTESPELPGGEEMQVESAQEGFTATVHRVVRDRDGTIIDETSLTSTYAASRNTILRGTGPVDAD
jgi:vancomycin resistance protein YoaR